LAGFLYYFGNEIERPIREYQEAATIQIDLVKRFPDIPEYKQNLKSSCNNLWTILEVFRTSKARVDSDEKWDGEQWYRIARLFAVVSNALSDEKMAYSERAMVLLEQAISVGFTTAENVSHLSNDSDFDPLRNREDFQQLMKSFPNLPNATATPIQRTTSSQH